MTLHEINKNNLICGNPLVSEMDETHSFRLLGSFYSKQKKENYST